MQFKSKINLFSEPLLPPPPLPTTYDTAQSYHVDLPRTLYCNLCFLGNSFGDFSVGQFDAEFWDDLELSTNVSVSHIATNHTASRREGTRE